MDEGRDEKMNKELEKLSSKFETVLNDIRQKKQEIDQLDEEIESLSILPGDNRDSNNKKELSARLSKRQLDSTYMDNMALHTSNKKTFIQLSNEVNSDENKVKELEKKLTKNHERLENGLKQLDRENKRKEKLDSKAEKCEFFRDRHNKIYDDNKKLQQLLNEVLTYSKKKESLLCTDEADSILKAFNTEEKLRKEYEVDQLLIFKDLPEILTEQEELINKIDL